MDPILVLENDVTRRRWIRLALIAAHRSVLTFDTAARLLGYLGALRRSPPAILVSQTTAGADLAAIGAAVMRLTERQRIVLIGDPQLPLVGAPLPAVSEVLLPPLERHQLMVAIQETAWCGRIGYVAPPSIRA